MCVCVCNFQAEQILVGQASKQASKRGGVLTILYILFTCVDGNLHKNFIMTD